jgi:hypothetical protein
MPNRYNAIGVKEVDTGDITICAKGDPGANYHTLCGTSLDDTCFEEVPIACNARVDCPACHSVWQLARTFKANCFIQEIDK